MSKKWIVELGWSSKFAFDNFEEAASLLKTASQAQFCDTNVVENKMYATEDKAPRFSLTELEYLTADEYHEKKTEAA